MKDFIKIPFYILLFIGFLYILLSGTKSSQGYWYCWDKGDPKPHHLGHRVYGDHLCTDKELNH